MSWAVAGLACLASSLSAQESGVARFGERVDPADIGPQAAMDRRQAPKERGSGRCGSWVVSSPEQGSRPGSGSRCIYNKWGDTHMSVEFDGSVDLLEVTVAGHRDKTVWAQAIRFVGLRDGREVATHEWTELGATPETLELGLSGIDALVVEAIAPLGVVGGWYSLDDLLLRKNHGEEPILVGFETLELGALSGDVDGSGVHWGMGHASFSATHVGVAEHRRVPREDGDEATDEHAATQPVGAVPPAPMLVQSFPGPTFSSVGLGTFPSDICGASGVFGTSERFMAVVNTRIYVYDGSGSLLNNQTLESFFGVPSMVNLVDPRVVYDQHDGIFFVCATDLGDNTPCVGRNLYVAANTTGPSGTPVDPQLLGSWRKTSFVAGSGGDAGKYADYPTLGVNADGVYITALMAGCGIDTMTIFAIEKASLITPGAPIITAFRGFPVEGAIQPCVTALDGGAEYLISRSSSTQLLVRRIDGPLSNPTITQVGFVSVPSQSLPPSAPALGSMIPIDTTDHRLMNAVFRRGSIWTAHTVEVNGDNRASVRWYEVDPISLTAVQVGTISDPSLNYYYPTISVNQNGSVALGFSGSDALNYVSSYYCGRVASDTPGVVSSPVVLAAGMNMYQLTDGSGVNRWGDYSGTVVDFEDRCIWTIQGHADAVANVWTTRAAKLDLCDDVSNYCIGAPNSVGPGAIMGSSGNTSVADNDFTLTASGLPSGVPGQFYYGTTQIQTSFGDGLRCTGGMTQRLFPFDNADGSGVVSRLLDFPNLISNPIAPGDTRYFQFWYRDPMAGGTGFNQTDGLDVTFCP